MSDQSTITVRYWASARSAAGVDSDQLEVTGEESLQRVLTRAVARHPGTDLARVIEACSVLVDERSAGDDPASVMVQPGAQVDLLPPFAGGSR